MTGREAIDLAFAKMRLRSESDRMIMFQEFRVFWENYYEEKVEIIKKYLLNKPFTKEALNSIFFQSIDVIQKIINRKTAGIFDEGLEITLGEEESTNDWLYTFLEEIDFTSVVHETLRRSEFFNTVIVQPVWRDGKLDLDIITGDEAVVIPKQNFYEMDAIRVQRVNQETGELYWVYWDMENHYISENGIDKVATEDNPDMINPYGILPFSVFRKRKGLDFWGEPNWNLFLNQLSLDAKLSDNERGELYQKWAILFGVNTNFADGTRIDPGALLQVEQKDPSIPASLTSISNTVDWAQIRENMKDKEERVLMSEGIPASSASTDIKALSGSAKTIDEIELYEYRKSTMTKLYSFIYDLLEKIRVVYNYHANDKIPDNQEFYVEFIESTPQESEQDRKLRLETNKQFYIDGIIDIVAKEKGISREEAEQHINQIREEEIRLGLQKQTFAEQVREGNNQVNL